MLWFKHILFHFTWKGTVQSTNALLQPSPDNNSSAFNCSCSLCQYGGISRWCWRQTGTLTKFLRPGSPLHCWSQLHSLSTSPLWCYSRPEAGCIVCSLCEVKISRPRCKLPPSLPFQTISIPWTIYLHVLQHDGVVGAVCMHVLRPLMW